MIAYLAIASSGSLTVFFVLCTYFKFAALTDTTEFRVIMTLTQRRLYAPPQLLLVAISMGSIFGTMVIGVVISVVHAQVDRVLHKQTIRRRLRYRSSGGEVEPPRLPYGHFHIYLSHSRGQGQADMRVVKDRLREMVPRLEVFLDVDELTAVRQDVSHVGSGGRNAVGHKVHGVVGENTREGRRREAEYVDEAIMNCGMLLAFCTHEYLNNRACARELVRAVLLDRPVCVLVEPEVSRGGMSAAQCLQVVLHDRYAPLDNDHAPATLTWTERWALDAEVLRWGQEWGRGAPLHPPSTEQIAEALFSGQVLEWHRDPDLQHLTMRLIAEHSLRALADSQAQAGRSKRFGNLRGKAEFSTSFTFMECEVTQQLIKLPAAGEVSRFHLYCSPHNLGAFALCENLKRYMRVASKDRSELRVSENPNMLAECEHMLLYLTRATWTHGEKSDALARDVRNARRAGVHLLLVHESPSHLGDNNARLACPFEMFYSTGWTPRVLLDMKIYDQPVISLKGGGWLQVGLGMLAVEVSRLVARVPWVDADPIDLEQEEKAATGVKRHRRLVGRLRGAAMAANATKLGARSVQGPPKPMEFDPVAHVFGLIDGEDATAGGAPFAMDADPKYLTLNDAEDAREKVAFEKEDAIIRTLSISRTSSLAAKETQSPQRSSGLERTHSGLRNRGSTRAEKALAALPSFYPPAIDEIERDPRYTFELSDSDDEGGAKTGSSKDDDDEAMLMVGTSVAQVGIGVAEMQSDSTERTSERLARAAKIPMAAVAGRSLD